MSIANVAGDRTAFLKCETILDVSFEECVAYNFTYSSRMKMKMNNTKDVLLSDARNSNNHNLDNILVKKIGVGLRPRQWLTRHVWKRIHNPTEKIVHVYESIDESLHLEEKVDAFGCVRARTFGYILCEPNGESSIPSTKLKYVVKLDLGKVNSEHLVDSYASHFLGDYVKMRKKFCKDYEVDLENRSNFVDRIEASFEFTPSASERIDVDRAKMLFKSSQTCMMKERKIKTNNELLSGVVVQLEESTWCKLSTNVRCGREDALGFLLNVSSRSLISEHDIFAKKVEREEMGTGHENFTQCVTVTERKQLAGVNVKNTIRRRVTWEIQKSSDGCVIFSSPTNTKSNRENLDEPNLSRRRSSIFGTREKLLVDVKDESFVATKITQISEAETTIDMLISFPSTNVFRGGGDEDYVDKDRKDITKFLMRDNHDCRTMDTIQKSFQNWRRLEDLDERDGRIMGKRLISNGEGNFLDRSWTYNAKQTRVASFFHDLHAMRILKKRHPFLEVMIKVIIFGRSGEEGGEGKNNLDFSQMDNLEAMCANDGAVLGSSFLGLLGTAATEEGAYRSWERKFPGKIILSC